MRLGVTLWASLTVLSNAAWEQTGTTYHFQADTLAGTVWVAGENARLELRAGEGGTAAGRIEIWRDGGKQVFILNTVDRTYYEARAMDVPNRVRLPFGHRLELTSGHPQVDAAVAERLDALKGIPVARMLKVTRRIEHGDPVSATSVLVLSDIREVVIAADRFEVPKDYRFQEPEIVAPVRKHP